MKRSVFWAMAAGFVAASAVILAGCAGAPRETVYAPPPPPPSSHDQAYAEAPQSYHPYQAPAQAAPQANYQPMANDTCGAGALKYLIGKPRTEIPVPLQPDNRRVICSSCLVTQEYRADRQTIVFDADSGIIKSVDCG